MEIAKGSALDRALNHDDMDAARELEEEIEERGLYRAYTAHLIALTSIAGEVAGEGTHITQMEAWELIRATPEQRARAFLQAVGA